MRQSKLWDRTVVNVQVTDARERTMELRVLVSAGSAPVARDLRCEVREKLIAFLQRECPEALPRGRADVTLWEHAAAAAAPRREAQREPAHAR